MKIRTICWLAAVITLLSACSKDRSYEPDTDQPLTDSTFQPVTAGSAWHYRDSLQGDFTLTATGQDTTFDDIAYHVFQSKQDTSNTIMTAFFGKKDSSYYGRGLIADLDGINLLYLKDTTQNSSWSQTIDLGVDMLGMDHVTATIASVLSAVNTTETVGGKRYSQVSRVDFQIKVPLPLGAGDLTYGEGYWLCARGIGLLAMEIRSQGSVVASLYLTDYTIR